MSIARTTTTLEHVDVLIVGAGISGIGAAYHLQTEHPGEDVRDPRGARARSAAPGTCSATRASARTPTCTRSATRSSPGASDKAIAGGRRDPRLPARDRRARTASTRNIRFHHKVLGAAWSSDGRALDASTSSAPTPARRFQHQLRLAVLRRRLLQLRRGLHARSSRAASASRARSCTRSTGPRTSTTRQARRRDRQRRDRGDARSRDGAETAAHVTMLQRSPSYVMPVPAKDAIANAPAHSAAGTSAPIAITRRKNIAAAAGDLRLCQRLPARSRAG